LKLYTATAIGGVLGGAISNISLLTVGVTDGSSVSGSSPGLNTVQPDNSDNNTNARINFIVVLY
jgi:hypothetical protein